MFTGLTFDRVSRAKQLDCGFFEISPTFARRVLAERNPRNREFAPSKMGQIIEDFKTGAIQCNGESIVFSNEGNLIDGQHRLRGCAETGIPFVTLVALGVPAVAQDSIDQGKPRGIGGILAMDGFKNSNTLASIARAWIGYTRGDGTTLTNVGNIPRAQIIDAIQNREDLVEITEWACAHGSKVIGLCSPSILGQARAIMEPSLGLEAVHFLDRVAIGDNLSIGMPAFAVRERLLKSAHIKSRFYRLEVLMRGGLAQFEGRTLSRIQIEGKLPKMPATLRLAA